MWITLSLWMNYNLLITLRDWMYLGGRNHLQPFNEFYE